MARASLSLRLSDVGATAQELNQFLSRLRSSHSELRILNIVLLKISMTVNLVINKFYIKVIFHAKIVRNKIKVKDKRSLLKISDTSVIKAFEFSFPSR